MTNVPVKFVIVLYCVLNINDLFLENHCMYKLSKLMPILLMYRMIWKWAIWGGLIFANGKRIIHRQFNTSWCSPTASFFFLSHFTWPIVSGIHNSKFSFLHYTELDTVYSDLFLYYFHKKYLIIVWNHKIFIFVSVYLNCLNWIKNLKGKMSLFHINEDNVSLKHN